MLIKSVTPWFLSKRGHNNFIYPIFDETGLTHFIQDVEDYELKTWICGNSKLRAVVVAASNLKNIVGPDDARTVVWIDIEKSRLK